MTTASDLSGLFLDGRWMPTSGQGGLQVHDPSNGRVIAEVPSASASDVSGACEAARNAFGPWSATSVRERAAIVGEIAAGIARRSDELADAITREVGTPRHKCVRMQIDPAVGTFRSAARLGPTVLQDEQLDATVVRQVPVGVVACITPWNYPLYQIASKVAAALVAGCTVVLKPSEVAPTNAAILAEIATSSGLPPGVLNVVFGDGTGTGEALISDPEIDFVSFTGSTRAGARIASVAGSHIKQVALELGGKSASLVLPGTKLSEAVPRTLDKSFQNSGQTCAALTRLLVPEAELGPVCDVLRRALQAFTVGNPNEPATILGPVATEAQRDKVRGLTARARSSGAHLIASGPVNGDPSGYYVPAEAYLTTADDELAQEEVFGPVLAVVPYRDIEEAVWIANNSPYGLSGAVWGPDAQAAGRVAARIRTGSISINGAPTHPDAPFGGFRNSGFGRERGSHGIQEFLTTQAIHFLDESKSR